ncbi:MAG: DUF4299 family protein [Solobacterium sp.]|nr:DUF4299 family protein [Solobacterium sp.]
MPFELRIYQKGIFRYKLRQEDITGGVLRAGMHDRFLRFFDMIPDEGFMIVYHPDTIGTGIRMLWKQDMRDQVRIEVPGLTTRKDIQIMGECALRIMKRWHARTFEFEGREYAREELEGVLEVIRQKTTENRRNAKVNYSDGMRLVHGAMWPLTFTTERLRGLSDEDFTELLHRLQIMDFYWCSCHVYISDDEKGYQGVFTITAGVDTIIPREPVPPFGMSDPATGDEIVCDHYYAKLVTQHSRRTFLQTDYRAFLDLIHARSLIAYDDSHYILPAAMEDTLLALAETDGKENRP